MPGGFELQGHVSAPPNARLMSLEQGAYIAQIIASFGILLSLIFVGIQIKQNTAAMQRNEHNISMEEWTTLRQAIASNREIAELMTVGLSGEREIDAVDQVRIEQMLEEYVWAAFHIWEKTQRGVFPKGTFELMSRSILRTILRTERGGTWWRGIKPVGAAPEFVADVESLIDAP